MRDRYQVTLDSLAFVPRGFAAVCYTAHAGDGTAYFLKLWPHATPGSPSAAHLAAVLRWQRALADRHLLTRLPVPYVTRDNDLLTPVGGATLAVFPRLDGTAPPSHCPRSCGRSGRARSRSSIVPRRTCTT